MRWWERLLVILAMFAILAVALSLLLALGPIWR